MSSRQMTQSENAVQQVVVLFRELLSQMAEACSTHTNEVVFHFCEQEDIDYLVLRHLNTGARPFEEWPEEWLYDGAV